MIKIAIIGYGNIAKKHIEVFRALGCEIVASSNRSEVNNLKAKNEGRIQKTYTDFHEMLRNEKVDGLLVCASFDQLYHIAKEVIPYKIPVLLEKPAGTSMEEYQELVMLAEKHGTPVQIALNRRHYSVIKNAIEDAGGLEKITSVQVEWSEKPVYCLQEKGYTEKQTSQLIFGNSIHGLDLLTFIAGEVENADIKVVNFGEPFRWLMNVSGISPRGVLYNFYSSWDSPISWRLTFTAMGRRYVFAPLEKCMRFMDGAKDFDYIEPDNFDINFKAGFYGQAKAFLEGIQTKRFYHEFSIQSCSSSMHLANELTNKFYLTEVALRS